MGKSRELPRLSEKAGRRVNESQLRQSTCSRFARRMEPAVGFTCNKYILQEKKISSLAINNGVMKHGWLSIWLSVVYKLGSKRTCDCGQGLFLFMEKSQRWAALQTQAVQALDSDCSPCGCHSPSWICRCCLSSQQGKSRGPFSSGKKLEEEHLGSGVCPTRVECPSGQGSGLKVAVCLGVAANPRGGSWVLNKEETRPLFLRPELSLCSQRRWRMGTIST